jgi:hypothetical protein
VSLLMFLNEHSYRDVTSRADEIDVALLELIDVIKEIRRHRIDTALVTESPFPDLAIGGESVFRRWQADGRNVDLMRYIKAQRNRAPFAAVVDAESRYLVEYRYAGEEAEGLGYAHLSDGLALSLRLTADWNVPFVPLACQTVVEDPTGALIFEDSTENVHHASTMMHVARHRSWMCETGLRDVHTGSQIWDVRADVFPRLRFLPRVADDLARLSHNRVKSVKKMLAEFQEAVAGHTRTDGPVPAWPGKVTPEHEHRRSRSYLHDPQVGGEMLFDVHARFTPGAGRMHFRWDASASQVVVGYVGSKRE